MIWHVQDLVIGRPRDSEDRIDWQIEHARFEEALDLAEKDISLKVSTHQKVSFPSSKLSLSA